MTFCKLKVIQIKKDIIRLVMDVKEGSILSLKNFAFRAPMSTELQQTTQLSIRPLPGSYVTTVQRFSYLQLRFVLCFMLVKNEQHLYLLHYQAQNFSSFSFSGLLSCLLSSLSKRNSISEFHRQRVQRDSYFTQFRLEKCGN